MIVEINCFSSLGTVVVNSMKRAVSQVLPIPPAESKIQRGEKGLFSNSPLIWHGTHYLKSVVKPVLVTALTEVHSFQNLEIHAIHYIWKSALFFIETILFPACLTATLLLSAKQVLHFEHLEIARKYGGSYFCKTGVWATYTFLM